MRPARLQSLYPALGEFRRLLAEHDPDAKFRNAFLDRYVFAVA
jgi:xylitol oxidase